VNPTAICQSLDSHDSKMRNKLFPSTSGNQDFSGSLHAALLARRNRFKATTELVVHRGHTAGLHLNEIKMLSAATHDIDLTMSVAHTLTEDLMAPTGEKAHSDIFTAPPKSGSAVRRRCHRS
jgi:hypothetical protein